MQTLILVIPNKKYSNIIDIEWQNISELKKYDEIECHFVIYPYDREITADEIEIHPFEEYVEDILGHHKSVYEPINENLNKRFGLFLVLIAAILVAIFRPEDFLSIEVIVSIIGAYVAGKELWGDIEKYLIQFTKKSKFRYLENYYSYQLEGNTTLTQYSAFAKKQRYDKLALLPQKMEFIAQSNSKTIRLCFEGAAFTQKEENMHLFSLHLKEKWREKFEEEGYLLGVKISLNRKKMGIWSNKEYFQSLHSNEQGCLNEKSEWKKDATFFRQTFSVGKWKFFWKSGEIEKLQILKRS